MCLKLYYILEKKNYIDLFELHGKYDKRGADVLVSRKMFMPHICVL